MTLRLVDGADEAGAHHIIQFLEALWPGGVPAGHTLACTALHGGKPPAVLHALTLNVAAAWVGARAADSADVYVQAGVLTAARSAALSTGARGGAADVAQVPGFYVDVDVKQGHFADLAAAEAFAASLPLAPTLIVRSGGGLQLWWLFAEPFVIEDIAGRDYIEGLIYGWAAMCSSTASAQGVAHLDSVYDLARIGRVPGTDNWKTGKARRVTQAGPVGARYALSDFDMFATTAPRFGGVINSEVRRQVVATCSFSGDAVYPRAKFAALCANHDDFKRAWEHKRLDIKEQSNSTYDLTLVNVAVRAGWSLQEMVDLIISHRREYKNETKSHKRDPMRLRCPGYFARTIEAAITSHAREQAVTAAAAADEAAAVELEEVVQAAEGTEDGSAARTAALRLVNDFFSKHLKINIDKVERMGDDNPSYYAYVRGWPRTAVFASTKYLHSWQEWWHKAIEHGLNPVMRAPKGWPAAIAAMHMVLVVEIADASPQLALLEFLTTLHEEAADTQRADGGKEGESMIKRRAAALNAWGWFREADDIIIHVGSLCSRYGDHGAVRPYLNRPAMVGALKNLGAASSVVRTQKSTISIFRLTPAPGLYTREATEEGER